MFQAPSNPEIEKALEKVFSDPGFPWSQSDLQSKPGNLFLTLLHKVLGFLEKLAHGLDSLHHVSPVLFWIVFVLLLLILLLLLVHIGRTLAMGFRFALARGEEDAPSEKEKRRMRSNELRARARELAQEGGRGAEAIRFLLLSLLAFLEEKHLLHVAQGWTNRELFHRLEEKLAIKGNWEPLEVQVEQVSYAGRPLSPERFEEMERSLDALLGLGKGPQ